MIAACLISDRSTDIKKSHERELKAFLTGDDLLSRRASPEVSSAREGLTVVFGMGTGVTLNVIDTRYGISQGNSG